MRLDVFDTRTGAQHTDMSDRGPDSVKERIESQLDQFLGEDSDLRPAQTDKLTISSMKTPDSSGAHKSGPDDTSLSAAIMMSETALP